MRLTVFFVYRMLRNSSVRRTERPCSLPRLRNGVPDTVSRCYWRQLERHHEGLFHGWSWLSYRYFGWLYFFSIYSIYYMTKSAIPLALVEIIRDSLMMNRQPWDLNSVGTRPRSKPQMLLTISHVMSIVSGRLVCESFGLCNLAFFTVAPH